MNCQCGRPTRDAAYLCDTCLGAISRSLGDVPWLVEQLEVTITKQRASGASEGGRDASTPVPFHIAAAKVQNSLRVALVKWVRFCVEESVRHSSPGPAWPADNLVSMSRWLMWRVDGLSFNDLGTEAHDEITDAVAACWHIIDRPPERRYAGPCACGRDLYHKPGADKATCTLCGSTYDVAALYAWMKSQVRGKLVTAREGSALLSRFDMETKQATIDKWRERGRLMEKGHNADGHRVYLFDDLLGLAQYAQQRATSA